MTLPCLTNVLPGAGCRIHGEHLSACRGIRLDGGRATECTGCLPQPATRGLVCESCWERIDAALDVAVDHITHMRSVERGPQYESAPDRPKPSSRVIVPTSWLTADDTWAALRELAFRLDPFEFLDVRSGGTTAYAFGSRDSIDHVRGRVELAVDIVRAWGEDIVRRDHTADLAIRFYRAEQDALARYPLADRARPYPLIRCRACGHRTLERRPPLEYLDPITVRCIHPDCGAVWDPAIAEVDLAAVRRELEESLAASAA